MLPLALRPSLPDGGLAAAEVDESLFPQLLSFELSPDLERLCLEARERDAIDVAREEVTIVGALTAINRC